MEVGRNEPCPCGSGKKYKQCCRGKGDPETQARIRKYLLLTTVVVVAAVACGIFVSPEIGLLVGGVGLAAVAVAMWIGAPPPKSSGGGSPGAINFGR